MTQREIEEIMKAVEARLEKEEKAAEREGREFNIFNTLGDEPQEKNYELQDLKRNLIITNEIAKGYVEYMGKFSDKMLNEGYFIESFAINKCKDMMEHVVNMIERNL